MTATEATSLFPPAATTLTGGCLCSAIRYEIRTPEAASRPLVPDALPTPSLPCRYTGSSGGGDTIDTRDSQLGRDQTRTLPTTYPIIELDHCGDCRRACGSLAQCWMVVPLSWATFMLVRRWTHGIPWGKSLSDLETSMVELRTRDVLLGLRKWMESTYAMHYSSDGASHRTFCGKCGTGLSFFYRPPNPAKARGNDAERYRDTYDDDDEEVFDIAIGTLDHDSLNLIGGMGESAAEGIGIQRHSHWSSEKSVEWIKEGLYRGWPRVRHPGGLPVAVVEEDKVLVNRE
ncbi:uncharacterized protein AB675_7517 [Cyphellophora attinorum]|uniref:CENP-V/GFA domain-containing protein n=1 Tax=Cyphellophora attinorum TaxID=1664694 RepID=A0A0N1NZN3_9EURO|nr:uncharacterized protein AB675_7517 [Phialophora attinorum]KPI40583.1 hypothetical protein AB675_7517 [Phialophora attinorum]